MEFFEIEDFNSIRKVTINNLRKKNALNQAAYKALATILNTAGADDSVKCLVLTGKGNIYSSGNDLTQDFGSMEFGNGVLDEMIKAFIRFPKLLISIVNGPAIGIGATTLALADIVYACENAYFYTPFTALGLCAEGCSSVTFPKILGFSKASEMLMLNHKLTAQEAVKYNFVAEIYNNEQEVWEKLKQIDQLSLGSIKANKKLLRKFTINELEEANKLEIEELARRANSEEALLAIMRFSQVKKSKL